VSDRPEPLPSSPERLLPLTGAFNFRDLGGYPTAEGRSTRWGRVFRSDTLHELTAGDLVLLRDLGLRTVVDLRTPTELDRDGRGRLAHEPVRHINLSVLPEESGESQAAPPPIGGDMSARYLWYLEVGGEQLAAALRLVATDEEHPLVFHCMAGKDRTGVLSALVLDCLGVVRSAIVADYVQTGARLHLIVERLRQHPVYGQNMPAAPTAPITVDGSTIERFLDGVDIRYGGATEWARAAGVSSDTLDALRRCLLDDQ
jgi:protein tyrosine/serine phosphatase